MKGVSAALLVCCVILAIPSLIVSILYANEKAAEGAFVLSPKKCTVLKLEIEVHSCGSDDDDFGSSSSFRRFKKKQVDSRVEDERGAPEDLHELLAAGSMEKLRLSKRSYTCYGPQWQLQYWDKARSEWRGGVVRDSTRETSRDAIWTYMDEKHPQFSKIDCFYDASQEPGLTRDMRLEEPDAFGLMVAMAVLLSLMGLACFGGLFSYFWTKDDL